MTRVSFPATARAFPLLPHSDILLCLSIFPSSSHWRLTYQALHSCSSQADYSPQSRTVVCNTCIWWICGKKCTLTSPEGEQKYSSTLFNFGCRLGWMVNAMPQLLHPQEETHYPLYRRLGGLQGRSGRVQKILPHWNSIPGPSSPKSVSILTMPVFPNLFW
jgi:hypothetical protein